MYLLTVNICRIKRYKRLESATASRVIISAVPRAKWSDHDSSCGKSLELERLSVYRCGPEVGETMLMLMLLLVLMLVLVLMMMMMMVL